MSNFYRTPLTFLSALNNPSRSENGQLIICDIYEWFLSDTTCCLFFNLSLSSNFSFSSLSSGKSKRGELSIFPKTFIVLSHCLHMMPRQKVVPGSDNTNVKVNTGYWGFYYCFSFSLTGNCICFAENRCMGPRECQKPWPLHSKRSGIDKSSGSISCLFFYFYPFLFPLIAKLNLLKMLGNSLSSKIFGFDVEHRDSSYIQDPRKDHFLH